MILEIRYALLLILRNWGFQAARIIAYITSVSTEIRKSYSFNYYVIFIKNKNLKICYVGVRGIQMKILMSLIIEN